MLAVLTLRAHLLTKRKSAEKRLASGSKSDVLILPTEAKQAARDKRAARYRAKQAALTDEQKQAQREKRAAACRARKAKLSEEARQAQRDTQNAVNHTRRADPAVRAADTAANAARQRQQRANNEPVAQHARLQQNLARQFQKVEGEPAADARRAADAAARAQARAPRKGKPRTLRQRQLDAGAPYDNPAAADCEWCGAKLLKFERRSVTTGKALSTPCCSNGQARTMTPCPACESCFNVWHGCLCVRHLDQTHTVLTVLVSDVAAITCGATCTPFRRCNSSCADPAATA